MAKVALKAFGSQMIPKIRENIDHVFPLRLFALTLAALLVLLVVTLLVLFGLYGHAEPVAHPTGKVMATVTIEEEAPPEDITLAEKPPVPTSDVPTEATHETPSHEAQPDTPHGTALETSPPPAPQDSIEDSLAGLSEETDFGWLPITRHSDGMTSFSAYKAPFTLNADTKAVISLVMVDFGVSEKLSKEALDTLPSGTTYIASPYATNLQSKISIARSKGNEIWMHLPMQAAAPFASNDSGPYTLLAGLNDIQNTKRMNITLGKATGYAGVAVTVDPAYPDGSTDLQPLIKNIAERGLGLAQLAPTDDTLRMAAHQVAAPFIQSTRWIDSEQTKDALLAALQSAATDAQNKGFSVVAFRPSPLTFRVIHDWQKSLAAIHVQLAPLTYAEKQSRMEKPVESVSPSPVNTPIHSPVH